MNGYQFKIEITADMIHKMHLKGSNLMVFALLDYYTKKNGCCVHSVDTLARLLNMNGNTVYTAIRNLHIINHYIEVEKVIVSDGSTLHKIRTIV